MSGFRSAKPYVQYLKQQSKRLFPTWNDAYDYLDKEVFVNPLFQNHISQTSKLCNTNYLLTFEIVTEHLTDILFALDIAVGKKDQLKIGIYSYLNLHVGFMISVKDKKMFLEKFIKKNLNYESNRHDGTHRNIEKA